MTFRIHTLKKRSDFLRARKGRYFATPGLVLQASKTRAKGQSGIRNVLSSGDEDQTVSTGMAEARLIARDSVVEQTWFGFTATKKLGNAVIRNRIKRRLRDVVRLIAPQMARPGYEYVLIGRKSTLKRPFSSLLQDLTIAFTKVHANRGLGKRPEGKIKGHSGKK